MAKTEGVAVHPHPVKVQSKAAIGERARAKNTKRESGVRRVCIEKRKGKTLEGTRNLRVEKRCSVRLASQTSLCYPPHHFYFFFLNVAFASHGFCANMADVSYRAGRIGRTGGADGAKGDQAVVGEAN